MPETELLRESSLRGFEREIRPEISPIVDPSILERADRAASAACEYLFSTQHQDFHWCAELESNVTITSEYVLMCQALGISFPEPKREGMIQFIFSKQNQDGSWGIADLHPGDVSTTAETYIALRVLGIAREDARLLAAEKYIIACGGLEKVRIFTRIFLAMFGLFPWRAVPAIPPEFIFMPAKAPVNIYRLSSWARGTMVPLFIIAHYRPVYALPNGRSETNTYLDHLWLNPHDKEIPYSPSWARVLLENGISWRTVFTAADSLLRLYERGKLDRLRELALQRCEKWVLDHQETTGDWAGIFPPMINGVLALSLRGYSLDSDPVKKGIEAIERFAWKDRGGFRIQACVSPVWDTALSTVALCDSGVDSSDARLKGAMDWICEEQIRADYGDWKVYNPKAPSGGWAFEYDNTWYPDVDDTAAVILALLKQDRARAGSMTIESALDWLLSMQNKDGGWAAFDVDNNRVYLNEIPFSDMDSLCDMSCPDVTGRVLESFGLYRDSLLGNEDAENTPGLSDRLEKITWAIERGVTFLRTSQEEPGSWFGRWGVNYVYGTSHALCGLARAGIPISDSMVENALRWLASVQNDDGGWGESLESYADRKFMGKGPSCASQTAWGLMGLLAYLPSSNAAVLAGINWLTQHQIAASPETHDRHFSRVYSTARGFSPEDADDLPMMGGTWEERQFTGTGFPNHFYLRYHFYRHYFPMMALGRFIAAAKRELSTAPHSSGRGE